VTQQDIVRIRLENQQLSKSSFDDASNLICWFGAVQSQDYPGAKWALGQRISRITDEHVEQAFTDGKFLRTHVLRPTWHFVHPEDIRWMLRLTGPRISRSMGSYNKILELNAEVFSKAQKVIAKCLEEKNSATRQEVKQALATQGIQTNVQRLAHIVMQAELDGLIVSGPRRGKNFTYALLEERVPKAKDISMDEALAKLTLRYFTSHGPAQIRDFAWWSGLTQDHAKRGLEMNRASLTNERIGDKLYYFSPDTPNLPKIPNQIFLLPNYDEYTIAYRDRSDFYDADHTFRLYAGWALPYAHAIMYKGVIIGMWKGTPTNNGLIIEPNFAEKPDDVVKKKLNEAIEKYSAFLDQEVMIKK
jgi:hypothetical protein